MFLSRGYCCSVCEGTDLGPRPWTYEHYYGPRPVCTECADLYWVLLQFFELVVEMLGNVLPATCWGLELAHG